MLPKITSKRFEFPLDNSDIELLTPPTCQRVRYLLDGTCGPLPLPILERGRNLFESSCSTLRTESEGKNAWVEQAFSNMLGCACRADRVVVMGGPTGSGKSTRIAVCLPRALGLPACGIVQVVPKNLVHRTLFNYFTGLKDECQCCMAYIWNGTTNLWPTQKPFVMLMSPDSLYHRMRGLSGWDDVQVRILDEVHSPKDIMVLLIFSYDIDLISTGHETAEHLRVFLMSATFDDKGSIG